MKKSYYLISMLLVALFGFNQSLSAQTTLFDGLIKVSDSTNEYWYYIENGHNNGGKINDKDGRFCSLISGYSSSYASTEGIRPNADRSSQRWKVVASDEENYYYIINQVGNYIEFDPDNTNKNYWAKNSAPADLANCKLQFFPFSPTTPSNFVKLARKGAATNYYIGSATPGTNSVVYESESAAASVTTQGLTENPRSWRFVAEAEMEAFYPSIYPLNTPNKQIIEWYYIKSTDKNITNNSNYLTLDPTSKKFILAEKSGNPENQLFGFVSNGYSSNAYVTKVVARGNNEALTLSSSILSTGSTAQNWIMRHAFSTNNEIQMMQAVLRTARTASGSILSNKLSNALPTFSMNFDTYDNEYTWVYEKIPASAVTVNYDENTTILTGADGEKVEYGQSHTITYSVKEGFVPEVKVNGELSTIGILADGIYTLQTPITQTTTIAITAHSPNATVTFSTTPGITVTSPTLDNNQCQSLSNLKITFTIEKGYTNPTITATNATIVSDPTLEAGTYTGLLTEVKDGATISISTDAIEFAITTTATEEILWEEIPATTATYITPYTAQFKVAEGFHRPTVTVNKKYVTPTEAEGIYTITLAGVFEAKEIKVNAFASNILPVTEDTFVDGRQMTSTGLHTNAELQVQYSEGAYVRRSYMSFSAADFDATAYNKATLQMKIRRLDGKTNTTVGYMAAYTTDLSTPINEMSFSANGEKAGNSIKGTIISQKVGWVIKNTKIGALLNLNVTKHAIESAKEKGEIRLQVSGVDNGDGFFAFYSREGAATESTIFDQPKLIFERLPELTITTDENITLTQPSEAGVTIVESGESYTIEFTVKAEHIATIEVNGVNMTSELTQDNATYKLTINNIIADANIDIKASVTTSMDEVAANATRIFTADNKLNINTAKAQKVNIYSIQGELIRQITVDGQEVITLQKGVYLVKANGRTVKVQL